MLGLWTAATPVQPSSSVAPRRAQAVCLKLVQQNHGALGHARLASCSKRQADLYSGAVTFLCPDVAPSSGLGSCSSLLMVLLVRCLVTHCWMHWACSRHSAPMPWSTAHLAATPAPCPCPDSLAPATTVNQARPGTGCGWPRSLMHSRAKVRDTDKGVGKCCVGQGRAIPLVAAPGCCARTGRHACWTSSGPPCAATVCPLPPMLLSPAMGVWGSASKDRSRASLVQPRKPTDDVTAVETSAPLHASHCRGPPGTCAGGWLTAGAGPASLLQPVASPCSRSGYASRSVRWVCLHSERVSRPLLAALQS